MADFSGFETIPRSTKMDPTEVEIRRFVASDASEAWELHKVGLRQYGIDRGDGPWDDDLRDIMSTYLATRGEFLVAVNSDRLVGMGGLRQVDAAIAEIKRMRVRPDFQRRGIGTAILQRLVDRARELGYRSLILDTTALQVPAQKLYLKNGFVEVGSRADGIHELCFRKEL
jgi:GNAT superfamily N-acetyltransferase